MKTQENLPLFRGELALLLAVLVNSFGVVLMLYSGAGISAISSVPYAFSEVWPFFTLDLSVPGHSDRKPDDPAETLRPYVSVQLCGRLFLQRTVGYPQSMDRHPALHPAYAVCIFYHQLLAALHRYRFFQPLWTAYHSDRSFSKRTGTDHRNLLSKDQDQLRCDLPAHHSDPDFLIPRPDQGAGHRNHHGGIYHGKSNWIDW